MHNFQNPYIPRWAILAFGFVSLSLTASVQAVTPAEADAAFESFNKRDGETRTANYSARKRPAGKKPISGFRANLGIRSWTNTSGRIARRSSGSSMKFTTGFIKQYPDWTTNKYNDDIIWWAIACTRTSQTAASALAVVLCFADEEPKR